MRSLIVVPCTGPEFIELQHGLLRRFCRDPFDLLIINDAPNGSRGRAKDIAATCDRLGVRWVQMPQELHAQRRMVYKKPLKVDRNSPIDISSGPSSLAATTLQWVLNEHALCHFGHVLILHCDMLPFVPFSIAETLDGVHLVGVPQVRHHRFIKWHSVKYLWNGFLAFDPPSMPAKESFVIDCGVMRGIMTDTGGSLHYYLRRSGLRWRAISHRASMTWSAEDDSKLPAAVLDFLRQDPRNDPVSGNHFAEVYDDAFLHFRAGSNWDGHLSDDRLALLHRHLSRLY